MKFKKLALAAAVAALPATGFSMEAMEDTALSGVTGQDGISIGLATDITAGIRIHDKDGLTSISGDAGALVIDGFSITRANATDQITLDIDADGNGAAPVLNIAVGLPSDLTIALGSLEVASSNGASGTGDWGVADNIQVANLGTVTLGATDLNIQLGTEVQGSMIALDTTITNGVSISGFELLDANSGGSILTDLTVVDTGGGPDLTVDIGIDVDNTSGSAGTGALVVGLDGIGGVGSGIDVRMADLTLGGAGASAIGDVELVNLQLSGNLTITGK
ncbi:DUF6160 family protein [Alcanivorax sp.]|jgi:hypothetical protein|uniref:DUF6160 family protein n=1 Tax=Alcanivorax sp. TaxID=1872427 RepID=UPI0025C3CBE6|nr:DUF6160 family protein [Alcanivorax sp.]MEE3387293.1 DUF6160 family protein [Pseudomonadota bacterium]